MAFPTHRPRRLRRSPVLRDMVRETTLAPTDFIYPLFVVEGKDVRRPIASMPGIFNLSLEHAVAEAEQVHLPVEHVGNEAAGGVFEHEPWTGPRSIGVERAAVLGSAFAAARDAGKRPAVGLGSGRGVEVQ